MRSRVKSRNKNVQNQQEVRAINELIDPIVQRN